MKNYGIFFRIITLFVLIGFLLAACDIPTYSSYGNSTGGGNSSTEKEWRVRIYYTDSTSPGAQAHMELTKVYSVYAETASGAIRAAEKRFNDTYPDYIILWSEIL